MNANAELFFQVCQLQESYAQCIDNDDLESWPEKFLDVCLYEVQPKENEVQNLSAPLICCDTKKMLIDRVVSYRNANIYNLHYTRHVLGMPRILSVTQDLIKVQTNFAIFQTQLDGVSTLFLVGTYLDEIVNEGGSLKFKTKRCIIDTYSIDRLLATPV